MNRQEVTSILHFPINYLLSDDVINKVFLDEDQNKYFLNIYWKKNKIWGATAKILIDLINLLKIKMIKIIILLAILLILLFLVISRINNLNLFSRVPKLLIASIFVSLH